MVDENETLAPENQAAEEAEAENTPAAELEPRQDAETMAEDQMETAEPEILSLEETSVTDAGDSATPDEMDLSQAADQETEVAVRLGEGDLMEETTRAEMDEPAEDLSTAGLEQVAVAEEAAVAIPTPRVKRERVEERAARLSDEGVPDFSQVPQPDAESDGRAWYVVHCYSGYENKVRHNLEQRIESMGMKDKIFDVVVPTEEEIEVKEGKRRTVERRVFPGYILVNMILGEESWYVVRNTPGVTSFVGQGNTPLPLRPEEVSQIVKRMEADAPRIKVTFRQGERVRIVDGPFNDFRGTVSEIDMERAKVRVMVNFFGRETPVELDFLQVEKA